MPAERDVNSYLWDMLQAARRVVRFSEGKAEFDYIHDELLRSAIERPIEIIGEAARRVPRPIQQQHGHIAWQKIVAQRHVMAPQYDDIDLTLVWRVVRIHIPELIRQLEPLVQMPTDES
jgi:uncharacterized protein with HEPN domain